MEACIPWQILAVFLCLLEMKGLSRSLWDSRKQNWDERTVELNPDAEVEDVFEDFGEMPHRIQKRDYNYMDAYTKACNVTFDAWPDKVVTVVSPYQGKEQYRGGINCEFEMHGTEACQPHITCENIDLRESENCEEDYIMLSDGAGGSVKYCGQKSFSKPFKSRKSVFIFLNFRTSYSGKFDRHYRGFSCKLFCNGSSLANTSAVPLPEGDPVKEISSVVCGDKSGGGKDRIVGGENAIRGEFPWQAAFVYTGTRMPYCGGSLINSLYILTAAHCVENEQREIVDLDYMQVLLKGHFMDIETKVTPGQVNIIPGMDVVEDPAQSEDIIMNISAIIKHRFYHVFNAHEHDIALVRMHRPLDLKDKATPVPICLPRMDDENKEWGEPAGVMGTVSGWGYGHSLGSSTAKLLQKVQLPMVRRDKCAPVMEETALITEYMVCAGFLEGGKDACQGDSGGPLSIDQNGTIVQIGVVSFGEGCARKNKLGIYTNVAKYLPWIRHKTRDATWPRPP